jgi:diguanylate cyclase (GGDEF)-like protein
VAVGGGLALWLASQKGSPAALGAAVVLAVVAAVADPTLARPLSALPLAGIILALGGAAVLPGLLAQSAGVAAAAVAATYVEPPIPRLDDVLAPMTPQDLPVPSASGTSRQVPRRSIATERDAGEARTELDVIERYLRDTRDALGLTETAFWRYSPGEQTLEPTTTSAASREESHCFSDDGCAALIKMMRADRGIVANGENEPSLFLAGRVGKGDLFHGALAFYAEDRGKLARDGIRPWMGRHASHLALLIELLEESRSARRYRRRNQELIDGMNHIQNRLELPDLGPAVCEAAMQTASASRAAFVLWNAEAMEGSLYSVSPGHPLPAGFPVDLTSFVGECCRDQQRFAMREAFRVGADRRLYGAEEPQRRLGSFGIVPIVRARLALGAIVVEGEAPAQVTAVEVDKLMLIAAAAGVALENTEHFSAISERARRDELTGLRNRRAFDERLGQLLKECDRFGQTASLVLVDMDHFKRVNDTDGHEAGDEVLREVARIIELAVRTADTCARYGGEELAILLPHTGLVAATDVAERIRKNIEAATVRVRGKELRVTASLGVACYPESTQRGELLFRVADRALYEAKSAGRNCVRRALVSPVKKQA